MVHIHFSTSLGSKHFPFFLFPTSIGTSSLHLNTQAEYTIGHGFVNGVS